MLRAAVMTCAFPRERRPESAGRLAAIYPLLLLVEVALVAGSFAAWGLGLRAVTAAVFCTALVVVTATDLETRLIPNRVVLPATALVVAGITLAEPRAEWAVSAFAAGAFLLLAVLVNPGGMGMGDVKLAMLMGSALGYRVAIALILAIALSLGPSVYLFARHGRKARGMGFPFGPLLAVGSVVALFAGHAIAHWYLGR